MTKYAGAILALFLIGCSHPPPPRTAIQVTTREGATYIVVNPEAYYLRLCSEGLYPADGDPDETGLRAQRGSSLYVSDDVAWKDLASIAFGAPIGDLATTTHLCSGTPEAVAATVTMKDGSVSQKNFIDTTDRGIEGQSERGFVIIPVRAIAKLTMVDDAKWPWAEDTVIQKTGGETPTLRIATDAGLKTFETGHVDIRDDKYEGANEIAGPTATFNGYPVLLGGAELIIPWDKLTKIEVIAKDGQALSNSTNKVARLTFTDGHTEEGGTINAGVDAMGDLDIPLLPTIEVLKVRQLEQ